MKKLLLLSFALGLFAQYSCNNCRNVECFSPPQSLFFQLKDAQTGLDYLKSNRIAPEMVQIFSIDENVLHQIAYFDQDSVFLFRDSEIGWETGDHRTDYELRVDTIVIPFLYHTESVSDNCCAFFEVEEVVVNNQSVFDNAKNLLTFQINP